MARKKWGRKEIREQIEMRKKLDRPWIANHPLDIIARRELEQEQTKAALRRVEEAEENLTGEVLRRRCERLENLKRSFAPLIGRSN